ncbi:MAG: hypothetical protein LC772_00690 [Chloroflexi bacterium]|nr:hypothetical protein [Chloroflexota bacterium]
MATLYPTTAIADKKGRISLGASCAGKTFHIEQGEGETLVLTPATHVPESEAWLYKNPEALAMVRSGLREASEGRAEYVGSFADNADIRVD